jgi:hypothetical protein
MKRSASRQRNYKSQAFWCSGLRLLIVAAMLHLATTAATFSLGRRAIMPNTFDANGVAVAFADDGVGYREDAATLAEMLWGGKVHEWFSAAYPFHVKLYSICFASFGLILGFNILSAEPFNLFCYLGILLLVYKLGNEMFGSRAALIASSTVALWPTFLLHTTQLLKDPLFILGMLALIFVMVQLLMRAGSWRPSLLRGAWGGIIASVLWIARSDMGALLIGTVLLGTLMLVVRQFQLSRASPSNLTALALMTLLTVAALLWLPVYRDADNPRIKEAANNASHNPRPAAGVDWWQLPARVGLVRERFIEKYSNAGSNIDPYVKLTNTADLIRYLPRAVAIGLFAPFPNMWFETGSTVGLSGRVLAGFEMLITYAIELLAVVALCQRWRQLSLWLLFSIVTIGIAALGLVVVSIGTLYRLRYLYLILLTIPAAGALEFLLDWFLKSRNPNLGSHLTLPRST